MKMRLAALRALYAMPHIKGRDRLIGQLSDGFVARPTALAHDGLRMYLDASEYAQLEILVHGSSEPQTLALIRKLVTRGDTVVDVGAHVGHHALVAARQAGETGCVIAIDPQPYNADRISRHAALNGLANITTLCAAAGNADTFIKLPVQSERDRSRLSLHEGGPNDLAITVEVPLRRLDTIFAQHDVGDVKLLKIDVEGYELEVLQGLGDRLGACRNIVFELLPATGAARNAELLAFLAARGFAMTDVNGAPLQQGSAPPENNVWALRH
jgi:FkbM family methyltransferase